MSTVDIDRQLRSTHAEQVGGSALRLMRKFHRLGRKATKFGVVTGVISGALIFGAILLTAMWVDVIFDLSPRMRLIAWAIAALAMGAFATYRYLASRKASEPAELAKQLDQAAGSGGEIRSGFDLFANPTARHSADSLSGQMTRMAVNRASVLAQVVPDDDVVPIRPVVRTISIAAAASFAVMILAAGMPGLASHELERFFSPYADVPAYSQFEFHIWTNGNLQTYGSNVEVSATVVGPSVEQVHLIVVPPANERSVPIEQTKPIDELPMFPSPDGDWQATIASVKEDFEFYLKVGKARSRATSIEVLQVPQIEDIEVTIHPPEYTRARPYKGPVPKDGIQGLPGTIVKLQITTNRPLDGGELTYNSQAVSYHEPMHARDKSAVAVFAIEGDGIVECYVVDVEGNRSRSSISLPVYETRDEDPFVRLSKPQATSFATPDATIPVIVQAEDDYGIRRCQLYRSLNDSRFLPVDLDLESVEPTRAMPQMHLPISEFDLQPGDEIRLFARVEDNDPNGPDAPVGKGAESSLVSIRIISQQEFDDAQRQEIGLQNMMNRYQQAQRRLERLANELQNLQEELNSADPDSDVAKQLRQKMQDIAKQMKEDAKALKQLAESPLPFELDQQLAPQLNKMAQQLQKLSDQLSKAASSPQGKNKEAAEELKKQLDAIRKEQGRHQQEAMEPLEHLQHILPLKQAESEFIQLVQKQRSLADRLESLRNLGNELTIEQRVRMRELADEQNRIREQLADLVNQIEEKADSLPDEPELEKLRESALEFAKAVRDTDAASRMADAENSLSEKDGNQAHASADEAAKLLEALIGQCKSMGGQCQSCAASFSPSLGQCMSKTLSQMCPNPSMRSGGMGAGIGGSGGSSSSMSRMNNVGMYGNQPMMSPASGMSDRPQDSRPGGLYSDGASNSKGDGTSGFSASQAKRALGGADWSVPSRYRRQAGKYLQQLADELEN